MHMARWMVRPHMANAGISWDSCIAVIPGQRSVYLLDDPQYIMDNVPAKYKVRTKKKHVLHSNVIQFIYIVRETIIEDIKKIFK